MIHSTYNKDAGSNQQKIYINGSNEANSTYSTAITDNSVDVAFAKRSYSGAEYYFNGVIDEIRILNTALSSDWIATQYNNQNSPSSFASAGSPVTNSGSSSGSNTNVFQDSSYIYDVIGNIVRIDDKSESNTYKMVDYLYDDLYRLVTASSTNATTTDFIRTYSYDAIGNITNKSSKGDYSYEGNTGTRKENPHAVTSINGTGYNYDANGNLLSDGTWNHTWSYDNHLTQSTSTLETINYEYDYQGNRTKYSNGSADTIFANKLYDINGTNISKHIYAGDVLVATLEYNGTTTTTYYVHTDHLGGSSVISNESANLVQTIDYYPYGEIRTNTKETSFDESKKFTGHEYDGDTDLTYANARYYNQDVGKFLSQDPVFQNMGVDERTKKVLEDPQLANAYGYAANNPLKNVDTDGEFLDTILDIGFIAYDSYRLSDAIFNGGDVKGELRALGADFGGALIPGATGFGLGIRAVDKAGDAAKVVNKAKQFDAVAQQQKMLKGIENTKAINTIKDVFRAKDKIPGGTMGALRNEIQTGLKTGKTFHFDKADNTINRINNIFKTENLNKVETDRLQGISNSLQSLIKNK